MDTISRNLLRVARQAQNRVGSITQKYNLTAAEQPFFMALRQNDGLTQEELTALVGVDKSMTTRVIKSLEAKGFIRREQDENDKRRNRIYKTEALTKIADPVLAELLQFNAELTRGVCEDELADFMDTLNQLEENLAKYGKEES